MITCTTFACHEGTPELILLLLASTALWWQVPARETTLVTALPWGFSFNIYAIQQAKIICGRAVWSSKLLRIQRHLAASTFAALVGLRSGDLKVED